MNRREDNARGQGWYIYGETDICPINGKTGQGKLGILAPERRKKGGERDAARP